MLAYQCAFLPGFVLVATRTKKPVGLVIVYPTLQLQDLHLSDSNFLSKLVVTELKGSKAPFELCFGLLLLQSKLIFELFDLQFNPFS